MKKAQRLTRKQIITMAAIITATVSVEAFLGGMITVEALRGQTVLSGSNAAVATSNIETEDTGLYTELIDIDRFNQTAWSALDEQEMNFTLIAEDFINGRTSQANFSSVEEMLAFTDFFTQTYALVFRNDTAYYIGYYSNSDGSYTLLYDREQFDTNREETMARRVATMQAVIEKYKLHAYENPYEELLSIEDRINSFLSYNIDELRSSTYDSLHTDEGVCAHYAAILPKILSHRTELSIRKSMDIWQKIQYLPKISTFIPKSCRPFTLIKEETLVLGRFPLSSKLSHFSVKCV